MLKLILPILHHFRNEQDLEHCRIKTGQIKKSIFYQRIRICFHLVISGYLIMLLLGRMKHGYFLFQSFFSDISKYLLCLSLNLLPNPSYLFIPYLATCQFIDLSIHLFIYLHLALTCHLHVIIHCFKYFTNINSLFLTNLRYRYLYNFCSSDKSTEAEKGSVTCPMLYS